MFTVFVVVQNLCARLRAYIGTPLYKILATGLFIWMYLALDGIWGVVNEIKWIDGRSNVLCENCASHSYDSPAVVDGGD